MRWQVSKNLRPGPFGTAHYGTSNGGAFVAVPRILNISPDACASPYADVACLDLNGERVSLGDTSSVFRTAWVAEAAKIAEHDSMGPLVKEAMATGHIEPKSARAWMVQRKLAADPGEIFHTIARAENKWRKIKATAKQRAEKNLGRLLPWSSLSDLLFEGGFDGAMVKGFRGVPAGRIVTGEAFAG